MGLQKKKYKSGDNLNILNFTEQKQVMETAVYIKAILKN